jgi:outer membrane protein TolC
MRIHPIICGALCLSAVFEVSATASDAPLGVKGMEVFNKAPVRQWNGTLNVEEAVDLAVRQNPDVLKTLRELERSHGQVVEVRALALPHIALAANYNETDPKIVSPGLTAAASQNKSWRIALEVKQVIYSGGLVSSSIKAAKLAQDAAYYSLRDAVDRVVGQVRQQFAQVLVAEALVRVAQESVELANQQLKDAQNRFEAGTVPRFNVLRAEVEAANVKPGLIRAKNDFLIAQLQLAKILALEPSEGGKPCFQCIGELQISPRPLELADALGLAMARRTSLKAQRQQILIEKEKIVGALAGYKPRIDATGGYEVIQNSASQALDSSLRGYFLGITGSWKIFDSFETSGQVAQAKARMQSATAAYDDALRTVELEVQKAFADLQQYKETVESQQKNVEQAVEALRLAQERLSAGAGTQLEVLDARVALTRARTTEVQARADYVRSLAEFDRATATETEYTESFNDPLATLEKRVLSKVAQSQKDSTQKKKQ